MPENSATGINCNLVLQQEDIKKAEIIAKSIGIPPQHRIVLDIQQEVNKADADLGRIAELTARDVSLSAKVLKLANSPLFSRGGTGSVLHALSLIGIGNFYLVVLHAALQEAFAPFKLPLDAFWQHSQDVAAISAHIAKDLRLENNGRAYITGLFHDCGMPLLMKKFPRYSQTMERALEGMSVDPFSDRFETVVGHENSTFNTNHCLMGYIMAKSWMLPESVIQVILHHHHADIDIFKDPATRRLFSILQLSEFVAVSLKLTSSRLAGTIPKWALLHKKSLDEIGAEADSMKGIIDEIKIILD